ncbi:MAG: ATP-binding protein [Nannocystaceae bacterium]|nr:ATP-binding protein [Nannocystaceae bacterium]
MALASQTRVVVTGGPGAGKTTAADLFRRELGERVVVVPEAATLLFSGGFPRDGSPEVRRAAQSAIFHVQRNLEAIQAATYPERILLCDRGTIDGAAYWPAPPEDFFATHGTSLPTELARYDEVIFFETAAVGGLAIEGGNPTRIETLQQAVALHQRLLALWSQHPRFTFVPHEPSFLRKITAGLGVLENIIARHP